MRELVEYVAKNLVDTPDDVHVSVVHGDHATIIELQVARDEMGKVIGRQGRVANALRSLVKVAGIRQGRRVILEISD
ncbi:MAG: KH domain-containing protein [Chloroflexi bacterium]|nr:KH domain-containing protein [Chloroflexota bacterium]